MNKEKLFRNVFANVTIALVILGIALTAFAFDRAQVIDGNGEPIYSGKSDKYVSLMVNVYWGNECIQPMLDIFEQYNVKTTFFVGGVWANSNEELLKTISEAGHEIGNHGYNHRDHEHISAKSNYDEIHTTHELVKSIIDKDMNLFAPPSGAFSNDTLIQAAALGYQTVMWTRDTVDWRDKDADLIYSRAVKNVKGGDLILMHPTACTVEALERIITQIFAMGLTPSTVTNTLQGFVST